jgi:hypothetical protein
MSDKKKVYGWYTLSRELVPFSDDRFNGTNPITLDDTIPTMNYDYIELTDEIMNNNELLLYGSRGE